MSRQGKRPVSHSEGEARVDGPANALDLAGNVVTGVHIECTISCLVLAASFLAERGVHYLRVS